MNVHLIRSFAHAYPSLVLVDAFQAACGIMVG